MDFNQAKDNYREMIQKSIRFSGKDHDFFIQTKAEYMHCIRNQYFPSRDKLQLLDIGCGHGYIHKYLHNKGFEVTGIDTAGEVIELAKETYPDIAYCSYNGKQLPFQDHTFDATMAICVMHHVPSPEWGSFLAEMKRVVKPGGIAIIFEHNPYNPLTKWIVSKNPLDKEAVLLSSSHLTKLLQLAGFQSIQSRFILFTPFALSAFRWLDKRLGNIPLGAQYYTIAKDGR